MKRAMSSIYSLAMILVIIATPGFAFRMQGILTENGTPVAGTLRMLKYYYNNPTGSQQFSYPAALDASGKFDFTWNVGISSDGGDREAVALVYFAPGDAFVVGAALNSYKRIFEMEPVFDGKLQVSPGISDLPFLTNYSNIKIFDWCGLELRKRPGNTGFEFDATAGWCPEESGKLNTVATQSFPSGNRISNGSFENQFAAGFYDNWNTTGLPMGTNTGLNIPMGNLKPRTGVKAFRLQYSTSSPSGEQAVVTSSQFQVKPNTIYNLVFYYSAKDASNWGSSGFRPRVRTFAEKNGSQVNDIVYGRLGTNPYAVSTDTWVQYSHVFKTGPSAAFASVDLLCYSTVPIGGTFYFDDVMIVESDPAAPPGSNMHAVSAATTFTNGTGKPIQVRTQNTTQDIYSQTEYDELSRAVKTSLPVGGTLSALSSSNGYFPTVFNQANTQYNGSNGYPNATSFPFSETGYEPSPIGRTTLSSSPGYEWRASGDHTLRKYYSSTADTTPSSSEPPPATPATAKYAYELSKGEHNQLARTYTDKFGRMIRSENWMAVTNKWVGTDYEYDPNGKVSKVTPPAGSGGARVALTTKYNTLGQMLSESSPDFGENLTVYDAAGRLRFTQSHAQRKLPQPRMNYIKYDHLNRVVETGEFLDAAYFLPEYAEDGSFPSPLEDKRSVQTLNFYDRVPEDRKYCPDGIANQDYIVRTDAPLYSLREFRTFDEAYSQAYADMAGKASFTGQVRIIQVFDNPSQIISPPLGAIYSPLQLYSGNQQVGFKILGVLRGDSLYNQVVGRPFPFTVSWGPLSGRLVQTVSCNQELGPEASGSKQISTVFNYDKYGNTKDIFEYNGYIRDVAKQWQWTNQFYDAQNRLMGRKIYADASALTPEVAFYYSYNHLGKLDQVTDKYGTVIGKHTYNSIGQLSRLDVGQGASQARISYSYHVRGWLKKIEALSPAGVRLFSQDLKYEDGASGYKRYDGLVSEYDYATSTATPDKFTFLYGNLDRLAAAMTTAKASGQSTNPQWSYTYFDNGTLATATREGQGFGYNYETVSAGFTKNTNRLNSVGFTGTYPRNTSAINNFLYDSSGRMYTDFSREMNIQYSSNDLPFKFGYVKNNNSYTQIMVYDANGSRRSKLVFASGTSFVSATHYTSTGKEIREFYNQPMQEVYPLESYGRVVKNSSGQQEYEAYMKNHLGSTMKIHNLSTNSQAYKTDYEPFGKLRLQTATTAVSVTSKHTGKEHDDGTELDYFGARYYDAELGIWISPDPHRQYASPYTYCANNPVNCTDPNGKDGLPIPAQYYSDRSFAQGYHNSSGLGLGVPLVAAVGIGVTFWGVPALVGSLRTAWLIMAPPAATLAQQVSQIMSEKGQTMVTVFSRQGSAVIDAERQFFIAAGPEAQAAANLTRSGGTLFSGQIPQKLLELLIRSGGIEKKELIQQEGQAAAQAIEYKVLPEAGKYITPLLEAIPE